MTRRTPIPWISVVLTALPAVALLGSLALQTGCATKTGCFNCHINGVMANPSEPSAAPSSELTIQLETPSSSPVTTVKVNMENEDGKTESVKYDGSQVSGISSTAPTTIPDIALYDVDGKPPTSATVTIIFENGKSVVDSLTITPEGAGSGAVGDEPVGAVPMPVGEANEPIAPRPKQQLEEPAQQLEEPAPAPE